MELINISYDPTREFYQAYNQEFIRFWRELTGETITVKQLHGGGAAQAQCVIGGAKAHVVTLANPYDIDLIAEKTGRLPRTWVKRLPHNSMPYSSTIVFLVRQGNPKRIRDWFDLTKPGVEVILPNPKTSGGARWSYLAAWGYLLYQELGSWERLKGPTAFLAQNQALEFVREIFAHVPILDLGARAATQTFVESKRGDVLVTWENEALLAAKGASDLEVVVPSVSILAEPAVARLDQSSLEPALRDLAEAYLTFLFGPEGQGLAAKHHFRPIKPHLVEKEDLAQFPNLKMITVEQYFGGWAKAQAKHFDEGGTFDQIHPVKLPRWTRSQHELSL